MTDKDNELDISAYPLDSDGKWVGRKEAMLIYGKKTDNALDTYVSRQKRNGKPITNHHKKPSGMHGNETWSLKYFVPHHVLQDYEIGKEMEQKQQKEPLTIKTLNSVVTGALNKLKENQQQEQPQNNGLNDYVKDLLESKDKELNNLRSIKAYEQRIEDKDKQIQHLQNLHKQQQDQLVSILNQSSDEKVKQIKQHQEEMIKLYKELNKENRELQRELQQANDKLRQTEVVQDRYNDLSQKLSILLNKLNL